MVALATFRMAVSEIVINTLAEAQFTTPVDAASRVAMRVWKVQIRADIPAVGDPGADTIQRKTATATVTTRQNLTTMPVLSDVGVLANLSHSVDIWGALAAEGGSIAHAPGLFDWDFTPGGLLVAVRALSIYVQGVNANAGNLLSGRAIIYYDLLRLSPEDFFAAVALLTQVS